MTTTTGPLKDLWTHNADYRAESLAEIDTTLALLNLHSATALADIGCGNGLFSIAAARAFPQLRIFAYDALESAMAAFANAAKDLPRERFTTGVAPAEKLPMPGASVDRVLCRAVLHHIETPQLLYAEIARILRPGGELLLQAPCNYWPAEWSAFMSDIYMLMDPSHRRQYHTPAKIIAALSEVGLLTHRADCWPYTMNDVNESQRELIAKHHAAERVRLRQGDDGKWAVDFYWVRVRARKC